jgi:uncharacterized protein
MANGSPKNPVAVGLAVVCLVGVVFAVASATDRGAGDGAADESGSSLSEAVAAGDIELAQALLDAGADPDEPRFQGFTPLMRAANRDDTAMVEVLLGAGADLEATDLGGLTALHIAAEADSAAALAALLEAGADPNAPSANGMNTLHHAAAAGSTRVMQRIADTGADLDARSDGTTGGHGYPVDVGSTALGIAARAGYLEAVAELLDLGAEVDAPSDLGYTPLLMAVVSGQPPELVTMLLDAGADPTVRASCNTGCAYAEGDLLDWAHRLGDPDVIPLLEAALD